jgi:2-dehydropantoate 2-reductase
MRVLVMGAGAMGSLVGGTLALHGHDVTFVARGAHGAAMRECGLEIRTVSGETTLLSPVAVVGTPDEVCAPIDLVLFTVKGYDIETAAQALLPAIGPDTAVLPLLNGIDAADRLRVILGETAPLIGVALLTATVVSPGVVAQVGTHAQITLGEPDGTATVRVSEITAAFEEVGIAAAVSTEPRVALWRKFAMVAPVATLLSACMLPLGPVRATPEGWTLLLRLVDEAVVVGEACGVGLPADTAAWTAGQYRGFPDEFRPSMLVDYERGKRAELEQITGALVREGKERGVATPAFDTLYAVLKVRTSAPSSG